MVDNGSTRDEINLKSRFLDAPAKMGVLRVHEVAFVKSANLLKEACPDYQAGSGDDLYRFVIILIESGVAPQRKSFIGMKEIKYLNLGQLMWVKQ